MGWLAFAPGRRPCGLSWSSSEAGALHTTIRWSSRRCSRAPHAVIHPDENAARRLIHCITGHATCPQLVSRGRRARTHSACAYPSDVEAATCASSARVIEDECLSCHRQRCCGGGGGGGRRRLLLRPGRAERA